MTPNQSAICHTCEAPLSRQNSTGYCRAHVIEFNRKQPGYVDRMRQGIRRRYATDPAYLDDLRRRAKHLGDDPDVNHRRTRHFVERRMWEVGTLSARLPEVRAKAARSSSATRLAWCPPHLRDAYLHLVRIKRLAAAEARALIEDQNEVEMRRWRANLPDGLRRAG